MRSISKFFEVWKQNFSLLSTPLLSLIFIGLEKLLECEFKCPEGKPMRIFYSLIYFFLPFFIILILSTVVQLYGLPCSKSEWKKHVSICKALVPPLLWIVILLLDGRYFVCLFSPDEDVTGKNPKQSTNLHQISQILGFSVLLATVFIVSFLWHSETQEKHLLKQKAHECIRKQKEEALQEYFKKYLKCQYKPEPENVTEIPINSEEISKTINKFLNPSSEGAVGQGGAGEDVHLLRKSLLEQKAHEYIEKQKEEALEKYLKKHLKCQYKPEPEELTEICLDSAKISQTIIKFRNTPSEAAVGQGGTEGDAVSSPGTSSQSPRATSSTSPEEQSEV
ncbi:uncharacterized protein LOC142004771 [Carettochelys insculpta]|uniref:uncharacterized protein LOC142004771 n=1 Tax=Carettochelys insculpta TaxID=44489 RepID=UPI003EBAC579